MRYGIGITVAALALLGLCQCDGKKNEGIDMDIRAKSYPALDNAMAFDVKVDVTPAALAKLKAAGDMLVVDAAYYGLPTPAAMPRANQLHEIDLGDETVAADPTATRFHVTGALDRSQLKDVQGGLAYVFVNGYSDSKGATQDDLVSCSEYRGSIAQAQVAGTVALHCDLVTP